MCGREPRHRDPERRAGNVIEPGAMTERDARRVAAVFSADADLQPLAALAAESHADLHELPHTGLVDGRKRIALQDALLQVLAQESGLGVIARDTECGLREIVGAEGKELGILGDAVRNEGGSWHFNHSTELIRHFHALL